MQNGHTSQPLRIAIVGGGIGGLACALGLANQQRAGANIVFKVFEAAAQFKEIGAGVGVGPNAYRAISLLGLEEAYKGLSAKNEPGDPDIYFIWRYGLPDRVEANGGSDRICDTPCFQGGRHTSIHRARFLDMMIDRLPEGCSEFNKRLSTYEICDDGSKAPVILHFADGSNHDCDVLLAYDGIKSTVRSILLQDQMSAEDLKPQFTGTIAYRGLTPMDAIAAKIGEKARKSTMYLGKDRHILTFPIQLGKVLNIVAFASDRSNVPKWDKDEWIVPTTREEMLSNWTGWSHDCQAILDAIDKPDKWALHELKDLPTHAIGRVCLLGDSAAGTLPHQGQGAAQAIESAYTMSSLLGNKLVNRTNAQEALKVYDALRRERVTTVKNTSHHLGEILEFSDGHIDGDQVKLAENLRDRYNWMWEWDGEKEVAIGVEMLKTAIRVEAGHADALS